MHCLAHFLHSIRYFKFSDLQLKESLICRSSLVVEKVYLSWPCCRNRQVRQSSRFLMIQVYTRSGPTHWYVAVVLPLVVIIWLSVLAWSPLVGGGGTGGRETGRKWGGRCTGGGRRGGGKRDSQGGGRREKKGKLLNIAQCFAIEKMQRAGAKKYRAGTGIKGYGKREVQTPLSPPLL